MVHSEIFKDYRDAKLTNYEEYTLFRKRGLPMLWLFVILLLIVTTNSQHVQNRETVIRQDIKKPTPLPSPSPFLFTIGHLFSISESAPMTKVLKREKAFKGNFSIVQDFVESTEKTLLTSLQQQRAQMDSSGRNRVCNYEANDFQRSAEIFFEIRRLPKLEKDCATEYIVPTETNSYTRKQLHRAVQGVLSVVIENQEKLADLIVGNWSTPAVAKDFEYVNIAQICRLNNMGGLRIGEKWYFQIEVSNAGQYENSLDFHRQRISEFMRMKSKDELDMPLVYSMYHRPPGNETHQLVPNTTTVLWSGGGPMDPNFFRKQYPEDIPALADALERSSLRIEQVNDATSPSTIAILLLPVLLTLVPVAAFTTVETPTMLLYVLMSDIVSIVPLAVKGVELIGIGLTSDYGAALRITSSADGSPTPSSAVSLWTAQCKSQPRILITGVSFLVVAVVSMLTGIVLEFWCRRMAQRRKLKRELYTLATAIEFGEENIELIIDQIGAKGMHAPIVTYDRSTRQERK